MKKLFKKPIKKRWVVLAVILLLIIAFFWWALTDDDLDTGDSNETEEEEITQKSNADTWTSDRGITMQASQSDESIEIDRFVPEPNPDKGDKDTWTIFVYMCGSDLESNYGSASSDIQEMMDGYTSDSVRFVVETGGSTDWQMDGVSAKELNRFVVTGGEIEKVDKQPQASMGDTSTFSSFLTWGVENYASEHMGVILWNHGGGSTFGVCIDDNSDEDVLQLPEMDRAFFESYSQTGRKFEFVGFDACLMGTVETANILATYSKYMYGSEETEPDGGWDYIAIGEYLDSEPDANGKDLGKVVADTYKKSCDLSPFPNETTFSIIDLSKMDKLLEEFNAFSAGMYQASDDSAALGSMVRGIFNADDFGPNNDVDGYFNMIDMGGLVDACAPYVDGADSVKKALDDAVVYTVSGSDHKGASGLAMFYPKWEIDSEELKTFGQICLNPNYLAFVDKQVHNAAGEPSGGEYVDDNWYGEDGYWEYGSTDDEEYWDYAADYEPTGTSQYITFKQAPTIDDNGNYWFQLDENGINNTSKVTAEVYQVTDDRKDLILIGETIDVNADWNTGIIKDEFSGYWFSLPDGQDLCLYIVDNTDDYMVYSSPIYLNDEKVSLRIRYYFEDETIEVEGVCDISDNNMASRNVRKLKDGDVIVPYYDACSFETGEAIDYFGAEYVVSGDLQITYEAMDVSDYIYQFCIYDIYGDYSESEMVVFSVDEEGNLFYNLDLEDAFPELK
ncbi:MAG: hypothetical protein K5769_06665 [Pseudobutyrivibrio sp.]|nr:hypothetical protein [Pseudobutyrivibrio sp.]